MHREWKQGQIFWKESADTTQLCRDGVRKTKAQRELNLVMDVKNNKKGFYRYVTQKRKVRIVYSPNQIMFLEGVK